MIQSQLFSLLFVLFAGCSPEASPLESVYQPVDCTHVIQMKPDAGKPEIPDHISQKKSGAPITEPAKSTKIDLNTASQIELERLPGVGPALAKRIVAYRNKRRFKRLGDIRRVKGIGRAKFAKMKAMIRID